MDFVVYVDRVELSRNRHYSPEKVRHDRNDRYIFCCSFCDEYRNAIGMEFTLDRAYPHEDYDW